jgi:hypothetical protein
MSSYLRPLLITAALFPAVGMAQQGDRRVTQTQPFSYTYVELGYAETDYDAIGEAIGSGIDGDGLTLSGSVAINNEWHAFASYGNGDLDFGLDLDTWAIGAGYRYPLSDATDVYGRLMFVNVEVDVPGFGDVDDDGLGLQARLRHWVNDDFEVEGGLQYLNVDGSDLSLQAEGRYYFQDNFSVGAGLTFGGDTDGIAINARYIF